ncbi:hypothetical protein T02_9760 [Trichinella nativa]|uniref:Uncharacterized protein n=1 Tax=Trichinella nativa TaxID=6335 RepID=A0A0V1KKB3_9BILA|nr:hypothetical protein T06_13201 [Trichinella sp. T6]KRZ47438.1 hypothetical protein T02_3615 [Trichinella nativa]KRZ56077.1 hypothetical protein T02_9760 [Trichinella nativa]
MGLPHLEDTASFFKALRESNTARESGGCAGY